MTRRVIRPVRISLVLLVAFSVCWAPGMAQSGGPGSGGKSPKSGSQATSSGQGGGSEAPGGGPFSIETEMFTYKAVEHNSGVIACDIAQYLYHGEVMEAGTGAHSPCTIANAAASRPGIVLISSGSTVLSDFQNWRADMATMQGLLTRAHETCVAAAEKSGSEATPSGPHIRARGLLGTALGGLASPGEAASVAGDVLQMFSSNQSVTAVVGTVEDPALMNEVARELRSLGVRVLIPEMYDPFALGAIDAAHSPYLQTLQQVSDAFDKCSEDKSGYASGSAQAGEIDEVMSSIQSFLKTVTAAPAKSSSSSDSNTPSGAQTGGAPSSPPSHFASVLAADELARKIGFSPTGAMDTGSPWQHLLWVKALESGGSVTKQSNLFGTRVLFGGGAVDTYSVFGLEGDLVCSGNVYSFQQPVKIKDVGEAVAAPSPDSPAKWESQHSSCAPLNN